MNTAKLPYLVQMADRNDFDFGGDNDGCIARFACKGDAYAYAKQVRDALNRSCRVVSGCGRKHTIHFVLEAEGAVA